MQAHRRSDRTYRRALAGALVLSVLVHGAVLALAKFEIDLWPRGDRAAEAAEAEADRYLARQPLEVVRVTVADAAADETAASPTEAAESATLPAAAPFEPKVVSSPAPMDLTPVAERPTNAPPVPTAVADAGSSEPSVRNPNRGVVFVGANEAARLAERDLDRAEREGRLDGASGRGVGISIVGGGADCNTPATGVFDRFAGSFGRGRR